MIIYLHGFGSTGTSPKVDKLKERFGSENVFAPDLPFDPIEVKRTLQNIVREYWERIKLTGDDDRLIFVGTSLGGFYAHYFGVIYGGLSVLVNPSTKPSETLKNRLGPNRNYLTQDEFMVSLAHLEELEAMRTLAKANHDGSSVSLFLAKDDDVVPYEVALESFPYAKKLVVTEGGGHRYSDEYWDTVVDHIDDLVNFRD